MQLEHTVDSASRKTKPEWGHPPSLARSPTTLVGGHGRREASSGSGTFLGPVTTEGTNAAVERRTKAGGGSHPLQTLTVEYLSRHSVDSFASADCLLADDVGGGDGSGGIATNGRSSTGGGGRGGGAGIISDPLRTLMVEQHSRHSVDSFASADCLLPESGVGGAGDGGICNNGRSSTDGERRAELRV